MIKLYVDHLDDSSILIPFKGIGQKDPNDPTSSRFDVWEKIGKEHISLASLEDCDCVLYNYSFININQDFIKRVKHKKIIGFFNSDSDHEIEIDNSLIFRTSIKERKRSEEGFPAFVEDPGNVEFRTKMPTPTIGFCGQYGTPIRNTCLNLLKSSKNLKTKFILRDQFWAGAIGPNGLKPEAAKLKKEFTENIIRSDYTLCVRGGGNFSYRFYETLAAGRIPIFIDTNCIMPFTNEELNQEDKIRWEDYCLIIPENNINKLEELVLEYHNKMDEKQYIEQQKKCRKLWEEKLSPQGFYSNIWRYFPGTAIP